MLKYNKKYNLNDVMLIIASELLGLKCCFISNTDRWLSVSNGTDILFTTYGLRFPIDTPYVIEAANNKILEKSKLRNARLPFIPFELKKISDINKTDMNTYNVLKVFDGKKGKGVYTKVTASSLHTFIGLLKQQGDYCLLEPYITGEKYRVLILKDEVIGFQINKPPRIYGNGISTIKQLIEIFRENILNYIDYWETDEEIIHTIENQGFTLNSILPENNSLILSNTINLSRGASFENVNKNDKNYKNLISIALRASKAVGLNYCGADIIQQEDGSIFVLECNPSAGISNFTFDWNADFSISTINLAIPMLLINETINTMNSNISTFDCNSKTLSVKEFNSMVVKLKLN